jgi:hypothetical protein
MAGCAIDDAHDVQVRDSESPGPAKVSPEERLEQQRQLEQRQRDQQQQDRRQQDLERAQQRMEGPIFVSDLQKRPERIVALGDRQKDEASSLSGKRGSSVNGELLRMEGEYFVIRDDSGQEVRLQVTNETKMENAVQVGDRIEAQVSGRNHAETVRRVEKPKGN